MLTGARRLPDPGRLGPAGTGRELTRPEDAAAAVDELARLGAAAIKVSLNAEAGPTPTDAELSAICDAAHAADLPVTAHAQGAGQVERALGRGGRRARAHAVDPALGRGDRDRGGAGCGSCPRSTSSLRPGHARDPDGARQPPPVPRRRGNDHLRHRPRQRRRSHPASTRARRSCMAEAGLGAGGGPRGDGPRAARTRRPGGPDRAPPEPARRSPAFDDVTLVIRAGRVVAGG